MRNLKLVSVRLDPDDLDALTKFCSRHTYWKRNTVICGIISAVMKDFNERQIYDMVRRNRFVCEHVSTEYRIDQVKSPVDKDSTAAEMFEDK